MGVFVVLSSPQRLPEGGPGDLVARLQESFDPFLGERYRRPATVTSFRHAVVVEWEASDVPVARPALSRPGRRWAVTGLQDTRQELVNSYRGRADRLRARAPVWGSYSMVVGDVQAPRLLASATYPALESIHHGRFDDLVVVSNRALLAALALAGGRTTQVELDSDYLEHYLAFGFPVSDVSPFSGVRTVPARSALRVDGSDVSVVKQPTVRGWGREKLSTSEEAGQRLAEALRGAARRSVRDVDGPLQLRLSGGKDSRVMLAALSSVTELSTLTYGLAGDPDVVLGRKLAQMAGVEHTMAQPRMHHVGDPVGGAADSLRRAQGVPPSEAHMLLYEGAPLEPGQGGVALGHWPLYKGGMARRVKYPAGEAGESLRKQIAWFAGPRLRSRGIAALEAWADADLDKVTARSLYRFATDHRSGAYMHSHVNTYSSSARLAYPVSDSEVAHVCESMSMVHLVSERALFHALRDLWPEVAWVPLDRSQWRFVPSAAADPVLAPYLPVWDRGRQALEEEQKALLLTRDPSIKGSLSAAPELRALLLKHVTERAADPTAPEGFIEAAGRVREAMAGGSGLVPVRMRSKAVWRLFAADAWWSRRWLTAV